MAPRAIAPDMADLGKADNLLRQMRYGLGYDPLTELVGLARSKDTTNTEKIRIATELLGYTHPKMKAIQVNPDMGEVININVSYPDKHKAVEFSDMLQLEEATPEILKINNPDTE